MLERRFSSSWGRIDTGASTWDVAHSASQCGTRLKIQASLIIRYLNNTQLGNTLEEQSDTWGVGRRNGTHTNDKEGSLRVSEPVHWGSTIPKFAGG